MPVNIGYKCFYHSLHPLLMRIPDWHINTSEFGLLSRLNYFHILGCKEVGHLSLSF